MYNINQKPSPFINDCKKDHTTGHQIDGDGRCINQDFIVSSNPKGESAMEISNYIKEMLKTAVCLSCLAKNCIRCTDKYDITNRDVFLEDSWFCSVPCCVKIRKRFDTNFIGDGKINHAKFPKQFLDSPMASWPERAHLVLETSWDGVGLSTAGYKYTLHKVQCFIIAKGARTTERGECYVAKGKDTFIDTHTCKILCPKLTNTYYKNCISIDVANQMHQFELQLKKHWVTTDGYFCLVTAIFGMVTVDI